MRQAHWIKENRQERMPARMIAFDTESLFAGTDGLQIQSWRIGSAIRWRNDLKTGDHAEGKLIREPRELWQWVTEFCKPGTRTVMWAHNLGHDIRISQAFTLLPEFGWRLEWCNLDRNVSAMTWRSDHGTLVLADTWTWLPLPLNTIAPLAGTVKFDMPPDRGSEDEWDAYCMRDTEIVYRVVSRLVSYIRGNGLGNWQPTGAGMAYATWRHKHLRHKVLVHDDKDALGAERAAMHTGRAEAWRHGRLDGDLWTEVDLRNAYLMIGAECELPRKLRTRYGRLSPLHYHRLCERYRMLCHVRISTSNPVVAYRLDNRQVWPVGTFETWLWDTEVDCALRYGAQAEIMDSYAYAKAPILREWAQWILGILQDKEDNTDPVVKTWLKHCSRALIGRLSLRVPSWEILGANPEGITGITHMTDAETGHTSRLMHVGDRTLIEVMREEGRDSLPQVTGWIMAECRVRLWEAMNAAGLENIAHVDTDSLIINRAGLARLKRHYGADYSRIWAVKGSWRTLEVFGPRCYFRDRQRVTSGIPLRAEEVAPGVYAGERWRATAADLEESRGAVVTVERATWTLRRTDPRRRGQPGAGTLTEPYVVAGATAGSSVTEPSSAVGS